MVKKLFLIAAVCLLATTGLAAQSAGLAAAPGAETFVTGRLGTLAGGDLGAAARRFALVDSGVVHKAGAEDLIVAGLTEDRLGKVHVRLAQTIAGLPVAGAELIVHADAASGAVYAVNGRFVADRWLARKPKIGAAEALQRALTALGIHSWEYLGDAELSYAVATDSGKPHLTWMARVRYQSADGVEIDKVYADALSGLPVARHPEIHRALDRRTYTANNGTSLPGTLLFTEGGSSGDTVAMDAYDHAGSTYNFYSSTFGRDSYDGAGATINSTVHFDSSYNNAFWNGAQMVYGDGDGTTFSPLSGSLDVVAHELTHAVTENSANLIYQNESGALNESMSDVFGAATEVWVTGTINADTWKIGEDIYTPGTAGDALRYMDDPTSDGSSKDYYPERYVGSLDNGGVHWNSGISNLAFVLLTEGGSHPRGKTSVTVPALGIAKAEQIFYRALTVYLTSSSNFEAARNATAQAALDLYAASDEAAVHDAWDAVGVPGGPVSVTALTAGVPVTGLSGSTGSESYFSLEVPAGASDLDLTIAGGSGDADLYVKQGSLPTTSSYDCRPYLNGNNESCTFASPASGTWYVMLRAYSTYSGVTLTGDYVSGGGAPCTGCTQYSGSLTGSGDADVQPDGTYYYSSSSGVHHGWLEGPGSADFDLYLYKWNGSGWSQVASSLSATSSEEIAYSGSAGYYYWRIYSYSGSGSYDFWLDSP